MKIKCSKCGHPKDPDDFPWRDRKRGIRKRYCLECQGKYHQNWASKNPAQVADYRHARRKTYAKSRQAWLREYKDGKECQDCGKPFRHYVLDFDHRDRSTKRRGVAWMTNGSESLASIQRGVTGVHPT